LITGAQTVLHASPVFISARASRPIAPPVTRHSDRLNDIAVVIGKGKLVVGVVRAP